MKLALAIIVKDEFDLVKDIIIKYEQYFDEIALAVDKDIDKFKNFFVGKVKIFEYKWINDFSDKRNFLASKVESPYYFRIDTDDEIKNPEKIKEVFNNFVNSGADVVYFPYVYSRDEDGNSNALHWRETIIKKSSGVYWKKKIHENIFAEDINSFSGIKCGEVTIIHNLTEEHAKESSERNLKYLLDEYYADGDKTDPRTISYIGRILVGKGNYREAIPFLESLIERSGWNDDKYFAWCHLSDCYKSLGDLETAIACCNEALEISTKFPDAYIKKGAIYIDKEDYEKALDWLMPGLVRPVPDTTFVVIPSFYTVTAKIYTCIALLGKGEFDQALKVFLEVKKVSPNCDFVKTREKDIFEMCDTEKYIKSLSKVVSYTNNNSGDIEELIKSIPKKLKADERISALVTMYSKPKKWADNSIVIYCGQAWEDWAPPSTINGIGGSEEAVIYLSQELTKLGYEVTVYNSCGDYAGIYSGVEYKNYFEFNPNDEFNHFVAWRGNVLKNKLKAKTTSVWLHDVPQEGQFTVKDLENIDKIIVLSQFHKTLLPSFIPENKILVSSNGINLKDFNNLLEKRNPRRIIYTSSYDRGLVNLLDIWHDVIKEVPDAELHIFYGWETWIKMEQQGVRDPKIRIAMTKLMNQPGIYDHGRVGHKQLAKEFAKSGVYAYPSFFEEISCCVGDTPILMPRNHITHPSGVPIKELVGKSGFYVYSYDKDINKIVMGKVNKVWLSKKDAELLRITLDDGTVLRFTPEHLFMMRDGSWKMANELTVGDSLMPCYERPTFAVKQPSGDWDFEHRILGEKLFGDIKGQHIDHKNGNRYDNTPENLVAITPADHARKSFNPKTRYITKEGRARTTEASKLSVRERFTKEERTDWAKKQCSNMWNKVKLMSSEDRAKWLKNRHEKKLLTIANKNGFNTFEEYKNSLGNNQKAFFNHKVICIEKDNIREDVYDMEVEKYHNFSAGGVFVHNCISAMKAQASGCVPVTTDYAALAETVKIGIKVKGKAGDNNEEFKKSLIEILKSDERQEVLREELLKNKNMFSWELVAKQWQNQLFVSAKVDLVELLSAKA